MRLTSEEKDILKIILNNEIEYYEDKEDSYPEDIEYLEKIKKIEEKLYKEDK